MKRKKLNCLILCNGDIDKKFLLKFLKSNPKAILISADGASNILRKYKLTPDYIVGDFDSIKFSVLSYYKRAGVTIKKKSEQEHTDLEKSIMLALSLKLKNITVIGYAGKRIDHTINNFSILKRYYKKAHIRFLDSEFEIFYTNKPLEFKYHKGDIISFLGMPKADGVKTYGLVYPLNDESLEFGIREGTLNKALSNKVNIKLKKGSLLVFRKHHGNINQISFH